MKTSHLFIMLFCHLLCRFTDIWVETYHFKMNHTNIRYTFMISSARGHHIPFPFFPGSYFSSSLPRTCQSSSVFASIYLQKKIMNLCVVRIQFMECNLKKRCKKMPEWRNQSIEFRYEVTGNWIFINVTHETKDRRILPLYI